MNWIASATESVKPLAKTIKEGVAHAAQDPKTAAVTSGATVGSSFIPGGVASLAQLVGAALSFTLICYYVIRAVTEHRKAVLEREKLRLEIERLRRTD